MCRIITIRYTCRHRIDCQLSTCRGSFSFDTSDKTQRHVACQGDSSLTLTASTQCGSCELLGIRKPWEMRIAQHREKLECLRKQTEAASHDDDNDTGIQNELEQSEREMEELETAFGHMQWETRGQYPRVEGKSRQKIKPLALRQRSSLLRIEVQPDDIGGDMVDWQRRERKQSGRSVAVKW